MKFDDLLLHLGEFGTFQKRVYFLLCLTCITHGMRMVALVFLLLTPQHRCAIPGYWNDTYDVISADHQMVYNMSIPEDDTCQVYRPGNYTYDHYNRPINATTVKCDHWVFDTSLFTQTVASQFDLVCGNALKRSHATMMFYGGFLIGVFVLGAVSDLIGRKLCLYLSITLLLILGTSLAFASNYIMFVVLNFFVGASTTGIFSSAFVIGIEMVGPSKRTQTGMLIQLFFSFGVVALAGMAYLIRDWRHLELAITLPMTLFYLLWCFIPESPRWQIQKGRYDKARKTVEKAEKVNKAEVPETLKDKIMPRENSAQSIGKTSEKDLEHCMLSTKMGDDHLTNGQVNGHGEKGTQLTGPGKEENEERGRLVDMFKSKVLAVRTSIIFFNWAVISFTFYALNFNVRNLKTGSIFLNFFFVGLVEFPAHIVNLFTLDRFGRKAMHCFMLGTSGVACLLCLISIRFVPEDFQWVSVALAMLGKFGAAGGFGTIYMYSTEIYPTVIRNSALGASSSWARVGAMLAPYIAAQGATASGAFGRGLPLLVCGILILCTCALSALLPETLNRKLPETVADAKNFTKRREYENGVGGAGGKDAILEKSSMV